MAKVTDSNANSGSSRSSRNIWLLPSFLVLILVLGMSAFTLLAAQQARVEAERARVGAEGALLEAAGAKVQAGFVPQNSASFAGIYKLGEDQNTIRTLEGMKSLGIVVPSDWECQSQATTGVYPCPNGEPSECRFRYNPALETEGHCVYHYCTEDPRGPLDSCCEYYDGNIGVDIGSTDYGDSNYSTFATQSDAAAICSATSDFLETNNWHKYWYEDDSVDSDGEYVVTNAYINFQIIRLEFSQQYGLTLYSNSQDTVRIVRDITSSNCADANATAPDSCYTAYFKPISSSTLIAISSRGNYDSEAEPSERRRLINQKGSPKGPLTVHADVLMNRHSRFSHSCDSRKPGCKNEAVDEGNMMSMSTRQLLDSSATQQDRVKRRTLRGRSTRGRSFSSSGTYSLTSSNRAGND